MSRQVLQAVKYIENHLGEPMSVAYVSAQSGASPAHLERLFRAELGDSVWSYIQTERLLAARTALTCTDVPIAAIASQCGYPDAKHFSQRFKARFGSSPSKYRQFARSTVPDHGERRADVACN